MKFFITGTNTGVGKTYFSMLLVKHLAENGCRVKYIKPVQTGYPADNDAMEVLNFSHIPKENAATLFTAEPPVAPCLCFEKFPLDEAVDIISSATDYDYLIVEGAGGIAVPLDFNTFIYEIPKRCGLSVITVVPDKLGCVNEAVINNSFMKNNGINFYGFALNRHFSETKNDSKNAEIIEKILPGTIKFLFADKLVSSSI